ncbi:MAG: ABC transporter ATP-binding protein [Deltaproteobacteria bacterium HGW-Deltaproteobacteria-14]|nr:MAG: ABC transporter ATP-binding protein [Deltaproteobacteria bacterium HGW-Deltaproteobacteria-14]
MDSRPDTIRGLLARALAQLSPRRRRQFGLLVGLMLVGALAEVLSLGAVVPFISVLTQPEHLWGDDTVREIAGWFGVVDARGMALPISILFSALVVLSSFVRWLLYYVNAQLPRAVGRDLSVNLFSRSLGQPYAVHTTRSSSAMIAVIGQVDALISMIMNALVLGTSLVIGTAIIGTLVFVEPLIALIAAGGFTAIYLGVTRLTRASLRRSSRTLRRTQPQRMAALQEGFQGIREIIMHDVHDPFCDRFAAAEGQLRRAQTLVAVLQQTPRFVVQALGILLIVWIAYVLTTSASQAGHVSSALPVLGLLALGAQKLLPTFQNAYAAWAGIRSVRDPAADVLTLLEEPVCASHLGPRPEPMRMREDVRFEGVSFRYDRAADWVVDDLTFAVRRGSVTALVGATGGGKSTTADLLMGLLEPERGVIRVDGEPLTADNRRAWQRAISHVSQSVFLLNGSFTDNIAFGVPAAAVDPERVAWAAARAGIAADIEATPQRYASLVGEAGIRLSGGQRQRVNIARALYEGAHLLVLDEATSSLDNTTERDVMSAIMGLDDDVTVVMIAHRLTTVMGCDQILHIDGGTIAGHGTFDELRAHSPRFREMCEAVAIQRDGAG